MKKIAVLLLLVLALAGCGKKTHLFTINNQSDWDVVVALTDFKELGRFQTHSNYLIRKKTQFTFEFYQTGTCNLISVNGAKIINQNDSILTLANVLPRQIKLINKTDRNLYIKNVPALPCPVGSDYDDPRFYVPLFKPLTIENTHNTETTAKVMYIYAWQIESCKKDEDLNSLAIGIDISGNSGQVYSYYWQKKENDIFLIVSK